MAAISPPSSSATRTGLLEKNPGSMTHLKNALKRSADEGRTCRKNLFVATPVPGHHEYPAVDMQDVDVVPIELSEDVRSDDLLRSATRGTTSGEVDDPVHHRKQRVHLVRGEKDRDVLHCRDPVEERNDFVPAADVEICQR